MTLTSVRSQSPPARPPVDVDAYYRMMPEGLIGADERVELLEGEVVRMPPIGPGHAPRYADVVDELGRASFSATFEREVRVRVQGPIRLDRYNEPQPDIAILQAKAGGYRHEHPTAADVLLLIEVADSSLVEDRRRKVPLYASFGVPELWLVDLQGRKIEVYRQPAGGAYGERFEMREGILRPAALPGLAVDVGPILR